MVSASARISSGGAIDQPASADGEAMDQLSPRSGLSVFEEDIDFSLEAAVPDPMPFGAKLRSLLDDNEPFILVTPATAPDRLQPRFKIPCKYV